MRFVIATPVLNGMPSLLRCVGSVRGQDPGIDRIHVIQDGGSTDGTRIWLSQQPDVKVRLEPDAGMYDAIEKAWGLADGDAFSWLNSDEQYLPGTLQAVQEAFDAHPDVDILFGDTIIVDPDGYPFAARREIPLRAWYVKNTFLYAHSCSTFFRGRLHKQKKLKFDLQYRAVGDMELVLRLLNDGAVCRHIPRYLGIFGVDGKNLSLSERAKREHRDIQRRYGAYRLAPCRRLVHLARSTERLIRGCYRSDRISYQYARNEKPDYRNFADITAGFRFTYSRALSRLNKKSAD